MIIMIRFFFSFLSFVSSLQLIHTITRNIQSGYSYNPLLQVVFFTTISMAFFNLAMLAYYIPLIITFQTISDVFSANKIGKIACFVISMFGDFMFFSSVIWYADMAVILALALYGYSTPWLWNHSARRNALVWFICFLLWTGLLASFFLAGNTIDGYCWMGNISRDYYRYYLIFLFTPVLSTMMLSIVVLMIAIYQLKRRQTMLDITLFIGCFIIAWSLPSAHAISVWLDRESSWLREGHYMSLSVAGVLHYGVWVTLSSFTRNTLPTKSALSSYVFEKKSRSWHSYIVSTLFTPLDPELGSSASGMSSINQDSLVYNAV